METLIKEFLKESNSTELVFMVTTKFDTFNEVKRMQFFRYNGDISVNRREYYIKKLESFNKNIAFYCFDNTMISLDDFVYDYAEEEHEDEHGDYMEYWAASLEQFYDDYHRYKLNKNINELQRN